MFAYIGCRTTKHRNARGKGISVYDITPEGWHLLGITPILENRPIWLSIRISIFCIPFTVIMKK